VVSENGWRNFIVLSICLAFSAFYELIEWWAALLIGEDADAFLGTQGYVWDTQSDMGLALLGAICCLLVMQKEHDRQIKRLVW
jgi:putative membrane protein